MKEKIIKFLSKIGKKSKWFMIPVMGIMVVFLTIYHTVKKFLFDVKYHKLRMRTLTAVVSLAVVFTIIVLPSLAEENEEADNTVYVEEEAGTAEETGEKVPDDTVDLSSPDTVATQAPAEGTEEPVSSVQPEESFLPEDGLDTRSPFEDAEFTDEESIPDAGEEETTYEQGKDEKKGMVSDEVKSYRDSGKDAPLTASEPVVSTDIDQIHATYGKITEAPQNQITVAATPGDSKGTTEFSYQWKVKEAGSSASAVNASGNSTGTVYSIPEDMDAGSYEYFCEVTAKLSYDGQTATASKNTDVVNVTIDRAPLQQTLADDPSKVLSYDLSDVYYDGKSHGIGVAKKSSYAGIGDITVKYEDENGIVTTTVGTTGSEPEKAGTYQVSVTISQGKNYDAVTQDVDLGSLKIKYWSPAGTYSVDGTVSGTDEQGSEWYRETVSINPPSGCKISESEGDFKDSIVLSEGKKEITEIYFQKVPEGYISKPIEVNKEFCIDLSAPDVDISFTADAVNSLLNAVTGGGSAFRETQKVTVDATDHGSGVAEIYYYSTTEGAINYRNLSENDWIPYSEFKITATQAESTNYYIYAKAVDHAGNTGYASNEDIVMDSEAPGFSVDGNVINSEKRFVADEKILKVTDVNLAAVSVKRADSADADAAAATDVVMNYDIVEKDGKKQTAIALPSPSGTGGAYKYFVTAYDASGNSSSAVVIMVDPVSDVTVSKIEFAEQVYGYEDDSIQAEGFVCEKTASYTEPQDPNITRVDILENEGTDHDAFTVVDGTKIKPVNRLHAGKYTAKVRIYYNTDSSVLSTCTVQVRKAQLNAEYRGQDVWYHTINPDFTNYIHVTGFKYNESPADSENQPYQYTAPTVTNFTGPAVELGVHKMILGGGMAADYEFSYTDGYMRILRRGSDRYSIHGTKGSEMSGEEGVSWYTGSELAIVPDSGFMLAQDDSDVAAFSEQGFVIDTDTKKDVFTFYVMNISTGEISEPISFTYGKDSTEPKGTIKVEESAVRSFFRTITFGNFFTDTVDVTIDAEDDISDIASVQYCTSTAELDETALRTYNSWIDGDHFQITPEQADKVYIYAKIVNGAGLVTYLTTDEVVFDTKRPVISGVSDGAAYTAEQKQITVTDDYLTEVKLYEGSDTSGEAREQLVDTSNGRCVFTVNSADEAKIYTVTAADATGNTSVVTFSISKPVYEVSMEDKQLKNVVYGYTVAPSAVLDIENSGNAEIEITDINLGNEKDFVLTNRGQNVYEISAVKGLPAGDYSTKVTVYYNGTNKISAKYSFTVEKAVLTAAYKGEELAYNMVPDMSGKIEVTGFVNGETAATAAGYETPTIEFAGTAKETQVLVPKGGRADNYSFDYVKGVLSVTRTGAVEGSNGQYTVNGTKTETGWYSSDITITPNAGYQICEKENSAEILDQIVLTADTDSGRKEFYIKNSSTGEMYGKTVFLYMKDVVRPVITGVENGASYTGGERTVTVTDAYLASVTVNGAAQPVSEGSCTFTLSAKEASAVYVIVARDRAGNTTDKTVVFNKDGSISADNNADIDSETAGKISKKAVIVSGAPTAGITSSASDTARAVLNGGELTQVANGKNADIILKVKNIDNSVSQSEKELIIANLNGYTLGQYLDLSVYKSVDGSAEKKVSDLNKNISVTVNIPEKLLNTDPSRTRIFAMLRVHNGKVTLLQDQDSVSNTITFFTKKFSTYALVYKDVKSNSSSAGTDTETAGSGNVTGSGSPATGDTAPIMAVSIVLAASFVGIIVLLVVKRKLRRTEA